MYNNIQALSHWLREIGESIPTSVDASNLLANPVQAVKKMKKAPEELSQPATISASSIRDLVKKAKTLDELKQLMESFDGCEIKKLATNMVFGDGNPNAKVMLVGEAPGAEEDRMGLPFVGMSGKLLDQMLSYIGLNRANFYITNIIPWRPPGNRNPTPEETTAFLPFVERRIELIRPKILIMVGGVSAKSLLNTSVGITRLRGQWHKYKTEGMGEPIDAFAIYHPSYLLRSPGQKRVVWHDLLVLKKMLKEEGIL